MIEAKNLKKVYKTKKGVVVNALDNVSVKLPDTGMVFILGKSGSGKSTLLNVLGGLDSFDGGEIIIKGTSAKDFKQSHYDSYRNTYIGFIFQEYNVLEELTVGANVALAIELQGRKATDEEINSILKEVDLEGFGNRKPNELSGGQKQRVAIARALVKKPEIIMADEPTGALDSTTGKQVFDTLKKLSRDKLVLIVSHDREFSEQYADRIIELKDGVIISDVEKSSSFNEIEEFVDDADDSITYGESEITVKPGYTITEEDRIAINEYLAALSSGAKIKLGGKKEKKKVTSGDFVPTDESKIKSNKVGDFKLIKSKLSMKNAFKLGSGALNHKKVRLVFTILLSLVSFTLFGLADTIAAYNNISTATSSIYDTGVDYASYSKLIKYGSGDYERWEGNRTYLTPEEIETIKVKTGRNVIGVYKKNNDDFSFSSNLGSNAVEGMIPSVLYSDTFSGITAIDENLISEHGFTLLGNSRLPEADKNEIIVTKYVYDYFSKVGHVAFTNEGEVKSDITSENDLLGKTLTFGLTYNESNEYTIVGIIDTHFDTSRYEKLASSDAVFTVSAIESMALTAELESAQKYSFACVGFVNPKLLGDIVSKNMGEAETIEGSGNIQLYVVLDDSVNNYDELHSEDGEDNIVSREWFYSVYSLSNIKDKVIWTGAPLEALSENQIIVSADMLKALVSNNNSKTEILHDTSKLVGFEKTLFDMYQSGEININTYPNLASHFNSPRYFAAFSYAYNNVDAAKSAYAARIGIDVSEIENLFGNFDAEFYHSFAWTAEDEGAFSDIITNSMVTEYTNGLINRYGLSSMVLPQSLKDKLITKFTYNGVEYFSYDPSSLILSFQYNDSADDIAARKYAAENFTDALNYYKLLYNIQDVDLPNVNVAQVLGTYSNYLRGHSKAPEGFVPTSTVDFNVYKTQMFIEVYKTSPVSSKMILDINSYMTGAEKFIKNVEIVGVFADSNSGKPGYYRGNTVAVSEDIINAMLGGNRGGIYSYAVGVMPTDRQGINDLVKFSKTYMNDAKIVKFNLKNNVMEQLNMVDEILDVLGQVFFYIGIGFAVFASLMLANFISTSVAHKKQEIGILRAIGSRSNDVFRIFFAESFIIAMINYVLSLAGTITVTIVLNSLLREEAGLLITFLNFGIRQIGILLAVSLAVAFIATFLPVKKIASMKPIDAIKNRK